MEEDFTDKYLFEQANKRTFDNIASEINAMLSVAGRARVSIDENDQNEADINNGIINLKLNLWGVV